MNLDITYIDWQIPFFFDWKPGVKYKTCPKGRRAALTHGAAHAIIEILFVDKAGPVLWGETTHGNIERYFDRYFKPCLDKNNVNYKFDRLGKKLSIGNQYCDFRSADNPENWEGFGYRFIFLNEAGIILKNRSLYINSVLPMLLDFPDSKLIAGGVPKGKVLKDGTEHPFYTLCKRSQSGHPQYENLSLTSYSNPLLSEKDIKDLELEIEAFSPEQVRQEIYGEFIEMDALNPFAHQWRTARVTGPGVDHYPHEDKRAVFDPNKQIVIECDINLNPMAITFSHIWRDGKGEHDHTFNEMEIKNASIPLVIESIRKQYGQWLQAAVLGGDYSGMRGSIEHRQNWSIFKQIITGLGMSESQLKLVPNPTHAKSRADVNYVLLHHLDFIVNPDTCPNTCRDMRNVQCDAFGQIIKKDRKDVNQRGDFLDTIRAKVAYYHRSFIDKKL